MPYYLYFAKLASLNWMLVAVIAYYSPPCWGGAGGRALFYCMITSEASAPDRCRHTP